jgi:hypothetical protein
MLKKTIVYKDLDGNDREGDFYFHFTTAEIVDWAVGKGVGFDEYLKRIVAEQNIAGIMEAFKEIIGASYGVRSSDGASFKKSKELSDAFLTSEAYSALLIGFLTDADSATEFINGIMPAELKEGKHATALMNYAKQNHPRESVQELPVASAVRLAWKLEGRDPTDEEIDDMSEEELLQYVESTFDGALEDDRPAWEKEGREPTKAELMALPKATLAKYMREKTEMNRQQRRAAQFKRK